MPGLGQSVADRDRLYQDWVIPRKYSKIPYKRNIKTPGRALEKIMAVRLALGIDAFLIEMKLSDESGTGNASLIETKQSDEDSRTL